MDKLSPKKKIMYGAGDIGFSLTSTILGVYFLFFHDRSCGTQAGYRGHPDRHRKDLGFCK